MRVLIVEKDPFGRRLLEQIIRLEGYEVFIAECAKGAKRMARELRPDVMLMNVFYPLHADSEPLEQIKVRCNKSADPSLLVSCMGKCDRLSARSGASIFDRLPSNLKIRIVDRILRLCYGLKQFKRKSVGQCRLKVDSIFSLNDLESQRLLMGH